MRSTRRCYSGPSPEPADSPGIDLKEREEVADGRITAEQIVRTWDLDAELVVISACQSALGRQTEGEGYLGLAQALFAKGARSLILSLWKVDDEATALLMERFYQNLLGRRSDLDRPLTKVEALAEAKAWLRGLTSAERDRLRRRALGGQRGPIESLPPLAKSTDLQGPPGGDADHPFAHPYYWAAFILVGDARLKFAGRIDFTARTRTTPSSPDHRAGRGPR